MKLGAIAAAVGRGLFAGLAGTAVMTLSSTLEQELRGRPASTAPSDAAGKVLGVQPRGPEEKERFANLVHWGYGSAWGAVRGLLAAGGLSGRAADGVHFAAVWGASLALLPALEVAPKVTEMEPEEIAIDALHHAVYALATGYAFSLLGGEGAEDD